MAVEQRRAGAWAQARVLVFSLCAKTRPSAPHLDHPSKVRGELTLVFMLVRAAGLSLELGAHLLQ